MDLLLQFGHGMMEHCRTLLASWSGGTAILSPRDLTPEQLTRLADELRRRCAASVLLDPQFFLPHSDHERLTSHDYWPTNYATGTFWSGSELDAMLHALDDLNLTLHTTAVILPGLLASTIDDDWLNLQAQVAARARAMLPGRQLLATVALRADALRITSQVEELLEASEEWPVDGIYLIAEHPNAGYIVEDPNWLANKLDIVAHFRLAGQRVVVGYCTHQMLLLAAAGAREFAAGTWMNVRSFPPDKFSAALEEEIRQRATWYFCPQSLSEYKVPFLDIAWRQNLLDRMRPDRRLGSSYADTLFDGAQPSTVDFTEQSAFRHYLHSLRSLAGEARRSSFADTLAAHLQMIDEAEHVCERLSLGGVTGQLRDFGRAIDANRAALAVLERTRGPVLQRRWAEL